MTQPSRRCLHLLPLILLLLVPRPASAQFSGAIQGTITDSQKAVVADAVVMVTNTQSGVTRESVTTSDGVFRVLSLGPGAYRVEVVKPGFLKALRESVTVGISETVRLDFTLEVSGVQESVTVTTNGAARRDRAGPRVRARRSRCSSRRCRSAARNLYNLIALQPGVTGKGVSASISGGGGADDSFAGESAPRINASGQRDEANNYTVDETSTNGVARGGITNLTPNTESVEEVRVVSNNFSAVDGRSPGAQIQVITKAGTNQFRGSGSYYFQGDKLSAKNVFETLGAQVRQEPVRLQPRRPDREEPVVLLHVVRGVAADRRPGLDLHRRDPGVPQLHSCRRVRTASPRSCCATLPRPSIRRPTSATSAVRRQVRTSSAPPTASWTSGARSSCPKAGADGNQFNIRSDYELRPGKDRLYGNFYRTNSYAVTGGIRPPFNRPTPNTTHFGNINYTQTFSSSMLNEFRGGVMRLVGLPDTPAHLEIPGITITGASGFGQSGYPERLVADELGLQEHLHASSSRTTC